MDLGGPIQGKGGLEVATLESIRLLRFQAAMVDAGRLAGRGQRGIRQLAPALAQRRDFVSSRSEPLSFSLRV